MKVGTATFVGALGDGGIVGAMTANCGVAVGVFAPRPRSTLKLHARIRNKKLIARKVFFIWLLSNFLRAVTEMKRGVGHR